MAFNPGIPNPPDVPIGANSGRGVIGPRPAAQGGYTGPIGHGQRRAWLLARQAAQTQTRPGQQGGIGQVKSIGPAVDNSVRGIGPAMGKPVTPQIPAPMPQIQRQPKPAVDNTQMLMNRAAGVPQAQVQMPGVQDPQQAQMRDWLSKTNGANRKGY